MYQMLRLVLRLGFAAVNIFMAGMAGGIARLLFKKTAMVLLCFKADCLPRRTEMRDTIHGASI